MAVEVVLVRLPLVKVIVILPATLWDRLVKPARPLAAVMFVAPCSVPEPALRVPVTMALLSALPLMLLRKLPNWSLMRTTGC